MLSAFALLTIQFEDLAIAERPKSVSRSRHHPPPNRNHPRKSGAAASKARAQIIAFRAKTAVWIFDEVDVVAKIDLV